MEFIPASPFKLPQALFLAISLSVTAVPVAARVLLDLGYLETRIGHTIISAAIFNDILSLILLTSLTAVIHTGGLPRLDHLAFQIGMALVFLGIAIIAGHMLFPLGGRLLKSLRSTEIDFTALLVVAFAFALLAQALKLHFIIGAFLAGLFFVRRTIGPHAYIAVKARVSGITVGFLAPIFFRLDRHALRHLICSRRTDIPYTFDPHRFSLQTDRRRRAGLFEVPQPVPDIIRHLFSAIVIMTLVTTLLTPLVLRQILMTKGKDKDHSAN